MADSGDPGGLEGMDVVVLAGGPGTRISAVLKETPKLLAPISGRPLLEYLFDWLAPYGPARVVLCLGHLAERIETYLADHPARLPVTLSVEPAPLGTGGALVLACSLLRSDPFLVLNGDSFVNADLDAFLRTHRASGAPASMVCARVDDTSRFGRVELDGDERVVRFREKAEGEGGPGWINAGVYLLQREFLNGFEAGRPLSLETDVFAQAAPHTIQAFAGDFRFIDIGTPESLAAATAAMLHH